MSRRPAPRDEERENRIVMDIVVDAYGADEQAVGWYCYLEQQLQFPFQAVCIAKRAISPLQLKNQVEVVGMPDESECRHEMFVSIRWEDHQLAVPLAQLKPDRTATKGTLEGVADWHYWVSQGYEFG